jgi:type IV fimbrial biogenesis protein FimT
MVRSRARGAPRQRGFTLVELMVALAILAFMSLASGTFFGDLLANSRLREEGNALYAHVLTAQSEAIKRNGPVQLVVTATQVQVRDAANNTVLRTHVFNPAIAANAVTLNLGSDGRPTPFGQSVAINLSKPGSTCSVDLRCPGLRVDAGGAVRLCSNQQVNCT